MSPTILCCGGNVFSELLPSNGKGTQRPTDTHVQHFFCCCVCIRCRCLVMKEGYSLPSCYQRYEGYTYRHTEWWGDLWRTPLSWVCGSIKIFKKKTDFSSVCCIWGSRNHVCKDLILGCDVAQSGSSATFRRNVLLSSSESKSKPEKQQLERP
jgi:hypothetical protein